MYNRDAIIHAWCVRQLSYWQARRPSRKDALAYYESLNASEDSVFLFRVQDGCVTLIDKPAFYTLDDYDARSNGLVDRALMYLDFLQRTVRLRPPRGSGVVAIGMHDNPFETEAFPVFALEKPAGSRAVLLNDVDFMVFGFYRLPQVQDPCFYGRKLDRAVFVGATTGGVHTEESVAKLASPRLRAAVAFQDSDHVSFKLPVITQCATEVAAERMRSLGFGGAQYGWPYQFGHKFIISMDGNGAAFSRVAVALKSRSVLLKYDSPRELYYFSGLVPWLHYIPIGADQDIVDIVAIEREQPGHFQYVADAGRRFYRSFLNRAAVMSYASQLIEMYFSVFEP